MADVGGLCPNAGVDGPSYGRGMNNSPSGATWRPYLRVLADTAMDAATAGGWIAAGGLPPGRRRLARAGVMAAAVATAVPGFTAAKSAAKSAAESAPEPAPEPSGGHSSEPSAGHAAAEPSVDGATEAASEPSAAVAGGPGDDPAQEADAGSDPVRRAQPPLVVLKDTPITVTVAGQRSAAQVATVVAVLGVVTAASAGVAMAGRQLEKRWLARLIRQGHPHPHRALGLRMAAVWAAASLPARLMTARKQADDAR